MFEKNYPIDVEALFFCLASGSITRTNKRVLKGAEHIKENKFK